MTSSDERDGLRLDDALKLGGMVATGGEAKQRIQAGEVRVNGQVETRRKRRVGPGDVIEFAGEAFEIEANDDAGSGDGD